RLSRELPPAIVQVEFRPSGLQHQQVEMPVLVHVANAFDRETVFAQTGCLSRVGEARSSRREEGLIRFIASSLEFRIGNRMSLVTSAATLIKIDAGFAAFVIIAAPLHREVNQTVPVEVRGMNVDFI